MVGLVRNCRPEPPGYLRSGISCLGPAPWVARMTEIMHRSNSELMLDESGPVVTAPFGALETREWRWTRPMTRATLHDMARSRSYVITAEPAERARIEAELDAVFDEIGAVGEAVVELPYITHAYRATRP